MTKKEVLSEVLASNLSDEAKIFIIQNLGKNVADEGLPEISMSMGKESLTALKDYPFMCNENDLLKNTH